MPPLFSTLLAQEYITVFSGESRQIKVHRDCTVSRLRGGIHHVVSIEGDIIRVDHATR
jgi:hypothetical protein